MDVAPPSPRVALQGEERALSLRLAQGIDEGACGVGDLPGGSPRLLDLEEPGSDPAAGGDSLERLGDERFTGLDVFLELRGQLLLPSARGHRGALPNLEAGRRARRRARHRATAYPAAGAERRPHGRQHLAGDPSHEAPLGIVRRRRVRDRVQAHVVERRGRRLEHGEQLRDDLGRPAAQAERVGGGIGQEIDDLAARFQVGRVVEVGEDVALALELLGIRPRPGKARRPEEHRRVFIVPGRHRLADRERSGGLLHEHGVEDGAEADPGRVAAGGGRSRTDLLDRPRDVRLMSPDADEHTVGDAARHAQRARAARRDPDRHGPVVRQARGLAGADVDPAAVEQRAHQARARLELADARRLEPGQPHGGVAHTPAEQGATGRELVDRRDRRRRHGGVPVHRIRQERREENALGDAGRRRHQHVRVAPAEL